MTVAAKPSPLSAPRLPRVSDAQIGGARISDARIGDTETWMKLSDYVAATLGLHYPANRLVDLRRNFAKASIEFGFTDELACIRWLLSAPKNPQEYRATVQVLARYLTIGETYFLRDRPALEAIESDILPTLIRTRRAAGNRRLRIWCAACCTGEEAYTVAMLVHRLLPDLAEWDVTITATDLNADFLQRAKDATYGEWSFRDSPAWLRANYFSRTDDGRYVVKPEIRKMVAFMPLNLVDTASHTLGNTVRPEILTMDIVLCRNVLMYFTPQNIEKAVALIDKSLVDGGWLAVAPGETPAIAHRNFRATPFPGAVLLRKVVAKKALAAEVGISGVSDDESHQIVSLESGDPESTKATLKVSVSGSAAGEILTSEQAQDSRQDFNSRARAFADRGQTALALEQCELWLLADKLNPEAHYLRGMILMERGDRLEAERSLQRAIYLDESFVLVYLALGHEAAMRGDADKADKHYAQARRLLDAVSPDTPVAGGDGLTAAEVSDSLKTISGRAKRQSL